MLSVALYYHLNRTNNERPEDELIKYLFIQLIKILPLNRFYNGILVMIFLLQIDEQVKLCVNVFV